MRVVDAVVVVAGDDTPERAAVLRGQSEVLGHPLDDPDRPGDLRLAPEPAGTFLEVIQGLLRGDVEQNDEFEPIPFDEGRNPALGVNELPVEFGDLSPDRPVILGHVIATAAGREVVQ